MVIIVPSASSSLLYRELPVKPVTYFFFFYYQTTLIILKSSQLRKFVGTDLSKRIAFLQKSQNYEMNIKFIISIKCNKRK